MIIGVVSSVFFCGAGDTMNFELFQKLATEVGLNKKKKKTVRTTLIAKSTIDPAPAGASERADAGGDQEVVDKSSGEVPWCNNSIDPGDHPLPGCIDCFCGMIAALNAD